MQKNKFFHYFTFLIILLSLGIFLRFPSSSKAQTTTPLQIGWYSGIGIGDMTRIDTQKAAGETIQVAYTGPGLDPTEYLNKLQSDGIKSYLQLDPTQVANGDTASLVAYVNTYKNHPAIAGWYLYDEPEFNNVGPAVLVTDYNAIKAADPNHPIVISFGNGYCSYAFGPITNHPNYTDATDIVIFTQYPVHSQPEFQPYNNRYFMTDVYDMVSNCVNYLKGTNKKFISNVQGFNWGGLTDRDPTYGEERYFTYISFVHPIYGLTYWVDYRASTTLTNTVNTVMKEAQSLSKVLSGPGFEDPSVQVNNSAIFYKLGSDGINTYLVAVNNTINTVTPTFTLPTTITGSSSKLIYDAYNTTTQQYTDRTVPITKDSSNRPVFTDTFTSFQVHIYQLSGITATPVPTPTATPFHVPGDTNNDGKVDGIDYVTVILHFGQNTTAGYIAGDLNLDGKVDQSDLTLVIANIH